MSKTSVIITAAGIGRRMKSTLPKQFMVIHEKPVLMYTIERFYQYDPKMEIILTLPEDWLNHWEALISEYDFHVPHRIVEGGKERYHSIKKALEKCNGDIVVVHDGVRPLVNEQTIRDCIRAAISEGAAIPVVPLSESLRQIEGEMTKAVDRSEFMLVQTPQCFKREVIMEAYAKDFHVGITDDASLVEEAGYRIATVSGNVENIKITTQSDLKFAELFV